MKKAIQRITSQINTGRLSHAYLIFGDIIEAELCKAFEVEEADTFRINEEPVKIAKIRELTTWIHLKPHSSPRKIALIYRSEEMNVESANALLKILEEPPANSVLILQAFKKDRILPTILSRCQIIKVANKTTENLPDGYLSVAQITKMTVKERFDYALKIFQSENLKNFLLGWEQELRNDLLCGHNRLDLLSKISAARDLLLTNSSVKLLVENLLLEFK